MTTNKENKCRKCRFVLLWPLINSSHMQLAMLKPHIIKVFFSFVFFSMQSEKSPKEKKTEGSN